MFDDKCDDIAKYDKDDDELEQSVADVTVHFDY